MFLIANVLIFIESSFIRFDDVIGNNDVAKKLVDWLKRWNAVHLKKTVKVGPLAASFAF